MCVDAGVVCVLSLQVSGGITMHAFKFELANVYRNLTNVVLRISPTDPVAAAKKAVLVNSHYDSTLGTKGTAAAGGTAALVQLYWPPLWSCRTLFAIAFLHCWNLSCVTDSDTSCWGDATSCWEMPHI